MPVLPWNQQCRVCWILASSAVTGIGSSLPGFAIAGLWCSCAAPPRTQDSLETTGFVYILFIADKHAGHVMAGDLSGSQQRHHRLPCALQGHLVVCQAQRVAARGSRRLCSCRVPGHHRP